MAHFTLLFLSANVIVTRVFPLILSAIFFCEAFFPTKV